MHTKNIPSALRGFERFGMVRLNFTVDALSLGDNPAHVRTGVR
jgi:hypothetical protein